ncbi:MAG: pantetheine-phosphate adenylyltransferase [Parvularculales bacterium]
MTRIAIYPGTFDPVTNGHMDIIQRCCRLTDKLVVAVAVNDDKNPLFNLEERMAMVESEAKALKTRHGAEVVVRSFHGLLVNLAREENATMIIRGLRGSVDYEYEAQMTAMNHVMLPDVETVFLAASQEAGFISSTLVKQIARLDGDASLFVSPRVFKKISNKLADA